MKCEICHVNDATTRITRITNGKSAELFVCQACALQVPRLNGMSTSLTDVLFSFNNQVSQTAKDEFCTTCKGCGMTREMFRKKRIAGCEKCYEVFDEDIKSMLEGSRPRIDMDFDNSLIDGLREKLKRALEEERYEDAAKLRDEIRSLEGDGQ